MGHHPGRLDRELVAALRSGAPDATATLYDRFAPALYAYACGFVDASIASDVVYDSVWTSTARVGSLRDPGLFRAWLYAVVRAECGRVLRRTGSALDYLPATDPVARTAAEVREAREAVHLLDGTAREVVDLAVRHHLTSPELEAVLGSAGDGRVLAHAQDFVDRAVPRVPNALGTFSFLPLPPLPAHLRGRVLAVQPSESELFDLGRRLEPVNRDGFPRRDRRTRRALPVVAASVAVFAVLGVGASFAFPQDESADRPTLRPAAEPAQEAGTTASTTTIVPTTGTATPSESDSASASASPEEIPAYTTSVTTTAPSPVESTATTSSVAPTSSGGFTRRGGPGRETDAEDEPDRDDESSDAPGTETSKATPSRPPTTPRELPTFPGLPRSAG